jgi:protein FAM32A
MSDEYAVVNKSKLKLKCDSEIKKKKKKKDKEKLKEQAEMTIESSSSGQPRPPQGRPLTKAEESCKKMQEKIVSITTFRNVFSGCEY